MPPPAGFEPMPMPPMGGGAWSGSAPPPPIARGCVIGLVIAFTVFVAAPAPPACFFLARAKRAAEGSFQPGPLETGGP